MIRVEWSVILSICDLGDLKCDRANVIANVISNVIVARFGRSLAGV